MDETDRAIVNALQGGFPVCDEPYAAVARTLGIGEQELIDRLRGLLERGVLARFGPLYQVERMGGSFVLAALSAPDEDFDRLADLVNAFPEVAHNYRREHRLNMWFVLATETPDGQQEAITRIERETGYPVFNMPKIREYFVELKLHV